ncbi:MAG: MlaD family protein [Nitrospinota bacterium]|nr:MlaD family protein [Nitrospinota bacterium]
MAKQLAPEVKVGFFTIFAIVALLYLSMRTMGISSFTTEKAPTFNLKFRSVAGLESRSKVKLSGVEVGQVEKVLLEGRYARVYVRMTFPAEIRKDAIATIKTSGLLGEKYIEIEQGTTSFPILADGETLQNVEESAEITDLINKMKGSMDDIRVLTTSLKNLAKTMEGEQDLTSIMKNMNETTLNLSAFIKENREMVHTSMDSLTRIATDFAKVSPEITQDMARMSSLTRQILEKNQENLTESLVSLKELSDSMSGVLTDNRQNVKQIMDRMAQASARLDEIIDSINKASESAANTAKGLEKITMRIDSGEGTVGKFMTDSRVYDNLNDTLASAKSLVTQAEDFGMMVGARSEYQNDQEKWKTFFTLKLSPSPDKFYLAEVSEDLRRTDLTSSRNTLNSLLYTAMIGKRFSGVTLRGGLIESAAGAAVDLHLWDDNLTATAEVFNLSGYNADAPKAQVKAWMKWDFHKYMFLYAGGDELLNEKYKTWFAGGGILFDDKDLKLALSLR